MSQQAKARAEHSNPPLYHIYTIWLFTRSDIKTIIGPSTVFGLVSLLSGPALTTNPSPFVIGISTRLPIIAFWVWINLLPFSINNQRQPDSVEEDRENKGWRPMPSKRLTPEQAKKLMLAMYVMAVLSSLLVGGFWQCIGLVGLGYWYNDLRGADSNFFIRNFINGCGYICFISGALHVGSDRHITFLRPDAYRWLLIIGLVILTTVQAQDMHDQAGDSLRKRWTVPLVIGDVPARWSIAVMLGVWSWFCPAFWQLGVEGFVVPGTLATIVVLRYLFLRSVQQDRMTFRIYNMWIVSLYSLPLVARLTGKV